MTTDEGVYGQGGNADSYGRLYLTPSGAQKVTGGLQVAPLLTSTQGLATVNEGTSYLVKQINGTGATTTQTLTFTPPAAASAFELSIYIQVTTAGTSTIPKIAYTDEGGASVAATAVPCVNLGGTAYVISITATGRWNGYYAFDTDNSAGVITVTITPTGSTFNYDVQLFKTR